jgi:hypothetical protein
MRLHSTGPAYGIFCIAAVQEDVTVGLSRPTFSDLPENTIRESWVTTG